jgi:hypothetical protein
VGGGGVVAVCSFCPFPSPPPPPSNEPFKTGVAKFSGVDGGDWVKKGRRIPNFPEPGWFMNGKVTIEVEPQHEAIVRRALALAEELEQLALTAPAGQVVDACEEAVIERGRLFQSQVLGAAVARCVEAAEKKGRRSAVAPVDVRKKTVDPKNAS